MSGKVLEDGFLVFHKEASSSNQSHPIAEGVHGQVSSMAGDEEEDKIGIGLGRKREE